LERPWLKSWPAKVPQSLEYPEISVGEVLQRSAKESPEKVAVSYYGSQLNFGELDALVDQFARALQGLGISKGDRVAIYLPNIPQFLIAYYGTARVGGIIVTSSPLYRERELAHILIDSEAKLLVAWDKLYPYVQKIRDKTGLADVITTSIRDYPPSVSSLSSLKDVESYPCPGAKNMKTLLAKYHERPRRVEIEPRKDLALLQYTGGTTGTPKGAMLTHYNLVVNAVQFARFLYMRPGTEVHLSVLPFFHIYGMTAAMNAPIYTRSTMVLIPDPRDISAILLAIDKCKPTIFCGVPAMYIALVNQPDIHQYDLRSIRACISGAAPLPVEVQKRFEELTGGRLVEGYGLTEASPVTHVNPLDDPRKNRPGSIGIPLSDTECKITDLETGEHDLPPGVAGELVIQGPQVMAGYWNNPEESKTALRGGWLYTGDIATMDSDGYFWIIDRKKDMINVSGFKVWPREVEEILYEHPAVEETAVIGIPDAKSGEAVKAFVVLREGYQGKVTQEDLTTLCMMTIAPYKVPKVIEFRKELPKTPVGKILRKELMTPAPSSSR
jgi:long-chain acyl-CoA synthetase